MPQVLKFRQLNKNNGQFWYWGASLDPKERGGWVAPKLQDNYVDPDESQQYSGLNDKDGVEIYEGDIGEVVSAGIVTVTGIVRFLNGCFCLCWGTYQQELKYYIDMSFCKFKIIEKDKK